MPKIYFIALKILIYINSNYPIRKTILNVLMRYYIPTILKIQKLLYLD